MARPWLYKLVKANKPLKIKYSMDQILEEAGHTPLRLPPYHPDLNLIENIWGIVKGWVASRNVDHKIETVRRLCEEKFSSMTAEDWLPVCRRVQRIEEEYLQCEIPVDDVVDSLIINCSGV